MEFILNILVVLPLMGFIISLLIPKTNEKAISLAAIWMIGLHLTIFFSFAIYWLTSVHEPVFVNFLEIYQTKDFNFSLLFYFDSVSLVYMGVASILTFLVAIFSRYYVHRDPGFKRLFSTFQFFYFGLNIIVFSGNFETIFVGWEIIGITSFLLIAFYRDRFLPIKNALKVISVYRLGDISMLVAIWLSHHLLHENINFNKLNQLSFMDGILNASHYWGIIISILFVTAAVVKSAQFPFSSWLPRAMEGPTNSSAIFYGSLSVHLGAFLLLRTYPFWHHYDAVKTLIMVIGALTVIMASVTSSVQSTVKTQIAYSSIVQIGIIFIEIALGWHLLALVHFAGNAFLRTYQLLISPSVLNYLIHDQFYNYEKKPMKKYPMWIQRLRHTFFVLGLREWDLDFFQSRFMWLPFKKLGKHLKWLNNRWSLFLVILLIVTGAGYGFYPGRKHGEFYHTLTIVYAIIGMFLIIRAFTERENASRAWTMLTGSQLLVALSIALNEHVAVHQIVIYLSGVLVSSIVGYMCIKRLNYLENGSSLNNYHGHIYEHPRIGIVFLLACLGMAGFPFTPTFLGIDLLFSHIHPDQYFLAIFNAVGFVFLELSVLRIYSRLFLGPHIKTYHEIAYKSS